MGQAKTLDVRHKLIGMKKSNHSIKAIAEALQLSPATVKNIWKRYLTGGEEAFAASYVHCGRPIQAESEVCFRLIRLIRCLHPTWGVPYIMVRVREKYPEIRFQSIRHYQRRLFKQSGKMPKAVLPPRPQAERSRIGHDTWQIDAKERFAIQSGQEMCYLTIVDEATGALLATRAFPPQPNQSSTS